MGSIQNSINQMIGTAGTVAAIAEHLGKQDEQIKATQDVADATKENTNVAQKQFEELNKPDYGRNLTNAQAERKALASLMNAQYPGSLLKNYNPQTRITNAQNRADFYKLRESYLTAQEKERQAGIDYNYPAKQQMTHTLTEEEDNK